LFVALGAALWWLFRREPSSLSQERSSLVRERSSMVRSLLEAEAAAGAVEPESLSSLRKTSS
jgi:hypothetical protein